ERAGDLRPELLGEKPHFDRLPVQPQGFVANLLQARFLALDPLLAGFESRAAVGEFGFDRGAELVNRQLLAVFLFFPFLAGSDVESPIALKLLSMLVEQRFGGAKLLVALRHELFEVVCQLLSLLDCLAIDALPLGGQLLLFPLVLLLPKLLGVPEGSRLPIGLEPPLA